LTDDEAKARIKKIKDKHKKDDKNDKWCHYQRRRPRDLPW
jgi:hypothetical protein